MTIETSKKRGKWGVDRRLEFIDFRLQWEGRINRSDLVEFFGISEPQASTDLSRYQAARPENLRYDGSEKAYLATETFKPLFVSPAADSYLSELLSVGLELRDKNESFIGSPPDIGVLPVSKRWIDPAVLAQVLRAIRFKKELQVTYQSMTRGEAASRWMAPHALGFDGFRWHVRGYCHTRKRFQDFLFARIISISSERKLEIDPKDDSAWHNIVTVRIGPHPKLPHTKKAIVESDFGMCGGVASIEIRQALLFYLVRSMGLGKENENRPPEEQQIVLLNRSEIDAILDDNKTDSTGTFARTEIG